MNIFQILYFVFSLILNDNEIILDNLNMIDKSNELHWDNKNISSIDTELLPYDHNIISNKYLFSCNFLFFYLCMIIILASLKSEINKKLDLSLNI